MQGETIIFKIVVIGSINVGKTSLTNRFVYGKYSDAPLPTIESQYNSKTIEVRGKKIELQIWDTIGEEKFSRLTSTFYAGSTGVILVYDITDKNSFLDLRQWVNEVSRYVDSTQKLLIGNKKDLMANKRVDPQEAKEYAFDINVQFLMTSAKTGEGVDDAFSQLVGIILDNQTRSQQAKPKPIYLKPPPEEAIAKTPRGTPKTTPRSLGGSQSDLTNSPGTSSQSGTPMIPKSSNNNRQVHPKSCCCLVL